LGGVPSGLGNVSAEILPGDPGRLRAAADPGVEGVDGGELVEGELEVEDVEVLLDPRGTGAGPSVRVTFGPKRLAKPTGASSYCGTPTRLMTPPGRTMPIAWS
jgi:hypothetical protein